MGAGVSAAGEIFAEKGHFEQGLAAQEQESWASLMEEKQG